MHFYWHTLYNMVSSVYKQEERFGENLMFCMFEIRRLLEGVLISLSSSLGGLRLFYGDL